MQTMLSPVLFAANDYEEALETEALDEYEDDGYGDFDFELEEERSVEVQPFSALASGGTVTSGTEIVDYT